MKLIDKTATTRKSFVIYTLQLKMYWVLFIMSLHLLIGISGTYISISKQKAVGNNTSEVCEVYNGNGSTGTVDVLELSIDNVLSTDLVMWIDATGESSGWIRLLGCYYIKVNTTGSNYFLINISTSDHVMECNDNCRRFAEKQINYFGLQENVCICFIEGISNFIRSSQCNSRHCDDQSSDFCGYEDQVVIYYRDTGINISDHGRNCLSVSNSSNGPEIEDFQCNKKLPYLCIDNEDMIEIGGNNSVTPTVIRLPATWQEAVLNCTAMNKTIFSNMSTWPNLSDIDLKYNQNFWLGIFRRGKFYWGAENRSSCVAATLFDRKFYPFVSNCKMQHYVLCHSSSNPQSIEKEDENICLLTNCIIYLIISLVAVLVVVLAIISCCVFRKQKMKEHKNTESSGLRLEGTTDHSCDITPLNTQKRTPRSPDVVLYSLAQPMSRQPEILDSVNPYSVPDTSGSCCIMSARNTPETFEAKEKTGDTHKKYERNDSQRQEIDVKESEYNELNHTLRPAFDNGKANVYDKVKPKVLTLVKGETFIGSEYDSMVTLNAVKSQKGKT